MTRSAYSGTQSVVRALRLLKLFRSAPRLSLAQIRERAGLNRSTCYRLLTALEAEGLLEREPGGEHLRLGPELVALGRRALGRGELREIAGPVMAALAREVNETVTLEMLARDTPAEALPDETTGPAVSTPAAFDEVVIVAEALGDHLLGTQPSLGTRWPAHATSTGKVLLACGGPEAIERVRGTRPPAFTEHTLVSAERLAEELAGVAARGWATNVEELEPGFVAVAVPVRDPNGTALAALSIGGPKQRIPPARLEGLTAPLLQASAAIREELGV